MEQKAFLASFCRRQQRWCGDERRIVAVVLVGPGDLHHDLRNPTAAAKQMTDNRPSFVWLLYPERRRFSSVNLDGMAEVVESICGSCSERARLEDRIAELEELLGMADFDNPGLPWSPTIRRIAGLYAKRAFWSEAGLFAALYGGWPDVDQPREINIIGVWICKFRKALKPYGITIHNKFAEGYWIDEADQAKLRALIRPAADPTRNSEHS